ncbi:MAG TPA: DUF1415 domain-containing protein [Chitinophagaceae bacterium]|nr:DUF1415 domain-containing protein [Chitinophagaceae bacterium]
MDNFEVIEEMVRQTKKWITDVVIGLNFCPFASKVMKDRKVHFRMEPSETLSICLEAVMEEFDRLDKNNAIETTIIILPHSFHSFSNYLDFVALAEKLLKKHGYEGVYQIASFHPDYCFAGVQESDAANYTNRSPYPMLHIIREESIEQVLKQYPNAHEIADRNVNFAREKGEAYMKMLRDACMGL